MFPVQKQAAQKKSKHLKMQNDTETISENKPKISFWVSGARKHRRGFKLLNLVMSLSDTK